MTTEVDYWPLIRANLPRACRMLVDRIVHIQEHHPDLMDKLEARYRKGDAKYGGEWLGYVAPAQFWKDIDEEIFDGFIYPAMLLVWMVLQEWDGSPPE